MPKRNWTDEARNVVVNKVKEVYASSEVFEDRKLLALRFDSADGTVGIIEGEWCDEHGAQAELDEPGEYHYAIYWINPRWQHGLPRVSTTHIEDAPDAEYKWIGTKDEYLIDKEHMTETYLDKGFIYEEVE